MKNVQVCVIRARGLKRKNSLSLSLLNNIKMKTKTLCVAWIDPRHKFFSNFDASSETHPVWHLRFSASVPDDDDDENNDVSLRVEIHRQEPLFHLHTLLCSANIPLRQFLASSNKKSFEEEECATFQLRNAKDKPCGMIDIRVTVNRETDRAGVPEWQPAEPVTAYPAEMASEVPPGRPPDFPPPNFAYAYPPPRRPCPVPPPRVSAPPHQPYADPPAPPHQPYPYPYQDTYPYENSQYVGLPGSGSTANPAGNGGRLAGGAVAGAAAGGAVLLGLDGLASPFLEVSTDPLYYN